MQVYSNPNSVDEIDLRELFLIFWAYKIYIFIFCLMGIIYGEHHALNTSKEYTSTASFHLNEDTSNSLNLSRNIDTLANLTGLSSNNKNLIPDTQINGRIFIETINAELDFQSDPFFNTYDPETTGPLWITTLRRVLGLQKSSSDVQEEIWQNISNIYSKNIELDNTDDGAIKISFTHVDPVRAAKITNKIMEEVINVKREKSESMQSGQLSYLSETLAKALDDLELSQSNLKSFTLENSALPLESFAVGSLQLDALREQLNRTTKLYEAVAGLSIMLKNNTVSQSDYESLRQSYPIVDQVEFRRVLGQNEIISSWNWPDISSVTAVFDTLTERKNRLQSQLKASQIDAQRSSLALETFGRLEREAKIAEASYTVLIEQVKAQSMMAGYRPITSEIYEYASPSIKPSAPNRNLILTLGAVIGSFIGCVIALIISSLRGVFYSKRSLRTGAQAHFNESLRNLISLRNKNLIQIDTQIKKKKPQILRDIIVEIHKSETLQTVVTSSFAKITANKLAIALAVTIQSDEINIAVIDFSEKCKKQNLHTNLGTIGSFAITERKDRVSILKPESGLNAMELITQKDFLKNIQSLESKFNLVFLCADNNDALSLLRALEGRKMFHLTLARIKHTKSDNLLKMRSLLPIQGLLHD